MITQASMNLLFRSGLRKNFLDEWEQYPTEYNKFLKVGRTTEVEHAASIITGISRLFELGDGEPVIYQDPKMGPKVIGTDKEFASGIMITRRTKEDDKYGKANQGARWLAHAARMTYEYRAAALLDDAFTGNFFRGIDNLPLIHTAHTLINSPLTIANRPTTDVAFSVAGLNQLFDLAMQMKDENGDPIPMFPNKIVLGNNNSDYTTALAIWNSTLEPFSANNTDNVTRRRMANPTIEISHYKASAKSYFLIDDSRNDAHLLIRRGVNISDTQDFDTGATKFKADTRFMVWFVSWRGWWGANPT